jgi:cellulose synthase/poly-beta-1,6-N-acetylglucosamine synthase-like glycosyltransferase
MEVSVVVPARNAAQTIGECLEGLLAQTTPRERYEVIVVDDGSSDQTRDVVGRWQVKLLAQEHAGPAAARNRGVAEARGTIVLFTDADCVPAPEWIDEMARPFQNPDVVGVKGAYRTRQGGILPRFVQCEYEERYEKMARLKQIDFIDTYSAGYRREVFLSAGGFDTVYPDASVEDQEFSFRLAERGYKMVFNPRAVVYHQHPETLRAYFRRKFNIGYWKVRLLRNHPQKAMRDSHTPQTLKVQMAVALLLLPLLALTLVRYDLAWLAGLAASVFLISLVPFTVKALRRDLTIGLLSPFFLFVRAVALGAGMIRGVWGLALPGEGTDRDA